jgi:hypothetical protein
MISSDNVRSIFSLKDNDYNDKLSILKKYSKFAKYIANQKNIHVNLMGKVISVIKN